MRVAVAERPSQTSAAAEVDDLFPLMDASSGVSAALREEDGNLVIAYYLPECQDSAVVRFEDVSTWCYGGPSDERLSTHPLWGRGLTFYNFHRALTKDLPCWVATFHDGTFEVAASRVSVLAARQVGAAPAAALASAVGPGNDVLLG
jgi:hypothetical protein